MSKKLKSFLNYTGGKYKLLDQILPLFPKEFNSFIELFCGSGVVSTNIAINTNFKSITKNYLLNDSVKPLIDLLSYLNEVNIETFIENCMAIINQYNLTNTYKFSYDYYNADSSAGLGNINKESYLQLRNDFNNKLIRENYKNECFYILIIYSFNNQIRFNKEGKFNLPVGKRDFNKSMQDKLVNFSNVLNTANFRFSNLDFRDIIIPEKPAKKQVSDFIYADPPYSIGTASYNENGNWTKEDDYDLFNYLDEADKKNIKFALSNVTYHKGFENTQLINWSKKYKTHYLNHNYRNSNYHSRAKEYSTIEVLVTNY